MKKSVTIVCPECHESIIVSSGNRTYVCPYCHEDVEVGVYDGAFTPQPDMDTCGWAVSMWLLKSFRCRVPSGETLKKELGVEKVILPNGTIPWRLSKVLNSRKLEVVEKLAVLKKGERIQKPFSSKDPGMIRLFRRGGRAAVCFACTQLLNKEAGRLWAHWVGLEKFDGKIRVMDPMLVSGYTPLAEWNRIYKKYNDHIIAAYGFVKQQGKRR